MAGFPTRTSRAAFGPTYVNSFKVNDPQKEIDASIYNLAFWQLAASGLATPRAVIFCDASGTGCTTVEQLLAWDPFRVLGLLVWVRTGTGVYTCQFAATYPDMDGNAIPTNLRPGGAWITEANDKSSAYAKMLSPTQAEVKTYNAAGAAADLDFGCRFY
jgi:hypothetical protein